MVEFQLHSQDNLHFSMSTSDFNTFVIHNMHLSYHNCICCEYLQQYFPVFHSESERHTNMHQMRKENTKWWLLSEPCVLICMYESEITAFL